MSLWRKIVRGILVLTFGSALAVASVFTPIFSHVGVFALNVFSMLTLETATAPTAWAVLGGGLTKKNGEIILNHYSRSRADTIITLHGQNNLPVITSGAESPWLQEYIKSTLPEVVIISDNASMNTCENAIFSAKLLNHHELTGGVFLVTDRYHMARARRQFANAGIATVPQPAPLAIPLAWLSPKNNLIHSRRTVYEIVALARDIFRPQNNCRKSDQITLEEISTPRRKPKIFSQLYENQ